MPSFWFQIFCKVHFPNITDHRELNFVIFSCSTFQKVVIWTEELRRSSSLWDELCTVSLDLQVYRQKHVKACRNTKKHCRTRFIRMTHLPENISKDLHFPDVLEKCTEFASQLNYRRPENVKYDMNHER